MGSTEVIIPNAAKEYENETYIRFIFTAKEDTLFCSKGYEICFDQLKICGGTDKQMTGSSVTSFKETALDITITSGSTIYHFDKRHAVLTASAATEQSCSKSPCSSISSVLPPTTML